MECEPSYLVYGRRGIKRMILLILVGGDYGGLEEGLYVGRNNNTRECVKVMELGLLCFLVIFSSLPSLPL